MRTENKHDNGKGKKTRIKKEKSMETENLRTREQNTEEQEKRKQIVKTGNRTREIENKQNMRIEKRTRD